MLEVFASPFEGDFHALAQRLSTAFFRKMACRVKPLRRFDEARALPDDITHHLSYWRPELGAARLICRGGLPGPEDEICFSAQTLLLAYATEQISAIEVEVPALRPYVFCGHMLSGPRVRISGSATEVTVSGLDGERESLVLRKVVEPGMAPAWVADPATDLIPVGAAALAVRSDGGWMRRWQLGQETADVLADPREHLRGVAAALRTLESSAPELFVWVATLLREIVPLPECGPGATQSQSFLFWPGHVQLSQSTPLQTIAMLVHECSHQYFNMALWLGPLVKDGAPSAYSVLKRTVRPLDRILLGLHAFGNIGLALAHLASSEAVVHRDELDRLLSATCAQTRALDAALAPHAALHLEQYGIELYEPLRDRLRSTGLL